MNGSLTYGFTLTFTRNCLQRGDTVKVYQKLATYVYTWPREKSLASDLHKPKKTFANTRQKKFQEKKRSYTL